MDLRTAQATAAALGTEVKKRLPKGYGFFLMILPDPENSDWTCYASNLPRKTSKGAMRKFIYLDRVADPALPFQLILKRKAKPNTQ